MRPQDNSSVEPLIFDSDMGSLDEESDLRYFNPSVLRASPPTGLELDDLFLRPPSTTQMSDAFSDLTSKAPRTVPPDATDSKLSPPGARSESPEDSSNGSLSGSPFCHGRNTSFVSSSSEVFSPITIEPEKLFSTWPTPAALSLGDSAFDGIDSSATLLAKGECRTDAEIARSNKMMDSAFDFDSAASSPSPLTTENALDAKHITLGSGEMVNTGKPICKVDTSLPTQTASPFVFKQAPDMYSAYSKQQNGFRFWTGVPPHSELKGPFGGIKMNGASPLNATLSPSLNFKYSNGLDAGSYHSAAVFPMGDSNPMFHPAFPLESYIPPQLTVHPTSLKSRVETQIPIKLTLHPMPRGVKKLRLPSYTISKPKFFAKPETTSCSPDTFDLSVAVVCTSAMQDEERRQRAFARARGEQLSPKTSKKEDSNEDLQNDEDSPLKGGEVKICPGCIQRERKRASRKKQRKPEEDEMFQKDEDKRVIVFNTTEIKDWVDPPRATSPLGADASSPTPLLGSMQVELPMRIACYCRHQGEKLGFQVIFTIKDYTGAVIAQQMTNSIMITDDHKTHAPASQIPINPGLSDASNGKLFTNGSIDMGKQFVHQVPFKLSQSATDLQALRKQHYTPVTGPLGISQATHSALGTSSSRGLSRQAPLADVHGPSPKRRKPSTVAKIPSGVVALTKMEPAVSTTTQKPGSSSSTPLQPHAIPAKVQHEQQPFVMPSSMVTQFGNGPPTPITTDSAFFSPRSQPQNLDTFSQQSLISAPNSAQPSRPGTPSGSSRPDPQDQTVHTIQNTNLPPQMWSIPPNPPQQIPPMIHKLIPGEGSIIGGSEVTILGNGFFPGIEVVFGDTLATATTFWADKCLSCVTPPAVQVGFVPVVFKHEHPHFGQVQSTQSMIPKQQILFRYFDDQEHQICRLALNILAQKLGNPNDDAYQTAQRIMGRDPGRSWNYQGGFQNGQQRGGNSSSQGGNMSELDAKMLVYLEFIDLDDTPGAPKFNLQSTSGQTLLHFASSLGLTRFVAGLLARGASPDVQDNNGNSPLHLAAISGHTHIVHRLRLSGASAAARNFRGFTPADLASSLEAHQAVLVPPRHYRSRSVGSTSSMRRGLSSGSLNEFWESSLSNESTDSTSEISLSSDDDTVGNNTDNVAVDPVYYSLSRQPSSTPHPQSGYCIPSAGESAVDLPEAVATTENVPDADVGRTFSAPAALLAWRNHLAGQINHFQQSVNRVFPNLPALPPMPTLPDYQTHPMIQRISSLVPHRPTTSWSTNIMKDSWDRLTGNSSPPAYEELYPGGRTEEDHEVKKSSIVEAAIDAVLDRHFEEQPKATSSAPPLSFSASINDEVELGDVRIGRKSISRHQQEQLRKAHALKMKKINSDWNLFCFWIPVLICVVFAMLHSASPTVRQGVSEGYQLFKNRFVPGQRRPTVV
ncbi:SPT3 Dosage dependent suppressor of Ty-induced promoter mutations-like protein [Ophidiomyces ophidiicola]|nr:SPT3 Dosage dependent suppressor of Ty-induced promoter mutations-like protein [Ophidiomyces ophidiicola]KAI2014113.1 SPT3 Dosage dependent suppressor of Ty-induced promoter mutations-like protein [Ophidiomyces ophidiicola]KAI2133726.1 SPT3 Dosage dependent suppressor of Ty-induced promoter mutations-like protein [Ophidiomyces ophidiicola]KAI2135911.1 SPT3 Dosage dependent suppressor of Ty-induced promoter mutations-like protein [Ophidiomyces ophidiicola]KAI2213602.1 SPT3 Dosage dependent su